MYRVKYTKMVNRDNYIFFKHRLFLAIVMIIVSIQFVACSTSTESFNYESANMQFSKGNYKEAKKYIEKAIKSNENKAEYLILAGHIYTELDDNNKAIELFNKAIVESDNMVDLENNKECYRGKGIAYLKQEKYDKAIEQFDEATSIEVNESLDKDILKYEIDALYSSKKYEEAIELGDSYIKYFGKDSDIYIFQGKCYAELKKSKEMIEIFNKAIELGNVDSYYHLAKCYMRFNKPEEAVKNFELFLEKSANTEKEPVYLEMVNSLISVKEYDKALAIAKENSNSSNKEYSRTFKKCVVAILEAQNNYDDAYVAAKEYLADYPNDANMEKEVTFLETRIIK